MCRVGLDAAVFVSVFIVVAMHFVWLASIGVANFYVWCEGLVSVSVENYSIIVSEI